MNRLPHEEHVTLCLPHPNLAAFTHIILIGMDGRLFLPIDSTLQTTLKIPSIHAKALCLQLHLHSVTYAHKIVCSRRKLDNDPIHLPPRACHIYYKPP